MAALNGCQGVIRKNWFSPGANPQTSLPSVVFLQCDEYIQVTYAVYHSSCFNNMHSGPQTPGWPGIDPSWVPITPITASWEDSLFHGLKFHLH